MVSLQPGEARQFTLQRGKSAAGSDLIVESKDEMLEVRNGLVGARFRVGEKRFETPVFAKEMLAFFAAIQLRGGAWTGRGWFETPKKCRSFKVALAWCQFSRLGPGQASAP